MQAQIETAKRCVFLQKGMNYSGILNEKLIEQNFQRIVILFSGVILLYILK